MTNFTGTIHFYLPNREQVDTLRGADPDRDWRLFSTGVQVWIGQTYLRLRQLGMDVVLTCDPPDRGIVVTHADYVGALLGAQRWPASLVIVAARADRPPNRYAEFEIVQNSGTADGRRVHYVQHWPQPGLVRRDPARGDSIRTIAYKGMVGEVGETFKQSAWMDFIRENGLTWQCDATVWQGNGQTAYQDVAWNDYSEVDVIVAIRKDTSSLYPRKPASKLINAWAAGVPAILGPEQAYRELRRTPLDYIEATNAQEVSAAIDQLRANSALYRDMINNGLQRAQELNAEQCALRWREILECEIPRRSRTLTAFVSRIANQGIRYQLSRLGRALAQR